jgi:hypothetical protein
MTTLRQIEANRRNATLSSGPVTPEGKQRSRRNSLKHGLAGAGVVLPEDETELVAERKAEWHSSLRPWNVLEEWLVDEIVVASVQIDRCKAQEALLRTELAERAETSWAEDRRLAAEILGAGLAKKPALVSRQLQQSTQGCDWIIERWEALGRILEAKGDWSGSQKALALDLLGTPPELRDGPTRLDPASGEDISAHRAALVASEIQRLRTAQETVLSSRDAREQLAAELGLDADAPRPLALLRRYLAACRRRFSWSLNQLRRGKAASAQADPTPTPAPAAAPAPAPAPIPSPPPFDARLIDDDDEEDPFDDAADLDALFDSAEREGMNPRLLAELKVMKEMDAFLRSGRPAPGSAPAPARETSGAPSPSRPVVATPSGSGSPPARRASS